MDTGHGVFGLYSTLQIECVLIKTSMKQDKLNSFLIDFSDFLSKYYKADITSISADQRDDHVEAHIQKDDISQMVVSSKSGEITIRVNQEHWHIDDYNDPCDFNNIYTATINEVIGVLSCETVFYSYYDGNKLVGGGSYTGCPKDAIQNMEEYYQSPCTVFVNVWGEAPEVIRYKLDILETN